MTLAQDPKFNPREVGTVRVQNLDRALLKGQGGDLLEYDFHREGDGNQDLKMFTRNIKRVASELFGDPIYFRAHF
jgi:hypothetical protein